MNKRYLVRCGLFGLLVWCAFAQADPVFHSSVFAGNVFIDGTNPDNRAYSCRAVFSYHYFAGATLTPGKVDEAFTMAPNFSGRVVTSVIPSANVQIDGDIQTPCQ